MPGFRSGRRVAAGRAAIDLGKDNIRVNSYDMVTAPLGRPGQSEEVATFAVFLASGESLFATGSEFVVDCGLVTDLPHKF